MKVKLLKRLRKEAKAKYKIRIKNNRYEVVIVYATIPDFIRRICYTLESAKVELNLLRREYILEQLEKISPVKYLNL